MAIPLSTPQLLCAWLAMGVFTLCLVGLDHWFRRAERQWARDVAALLGPKQTPRQVFLARWVSPVLGGLWVLLVWPFTLVVLIALPVRDGLRRLRHWRDLRFRPLRRELVCPVSLEEAAGDLLAPGPEVRDIAAFNEGVQIGWTRFVASRPWGATLWRFDSLRHTRYSRAVTEHKTGYVWVTFMPRSLHYLRTYRHSLQHPYTDADRPPGPLTG